ncbi:phage tail tube protein [Devosia sp. YIM 151766]|uniref:phage tail tube protein n=1 Tax=Devosia sp. YIM 151766 TaxID=3017325 RepID=UPI00255CF9A7|nr:phage tail tube protein [Devosia sp. YIM 151766]WIY52459.1 phage tail tube protein [Devosia sp. YIM 151766]
MARAQGARSQLAAAFETVYGTPPSSGYTKLPFASTTLGSAQPLIASELLGYGRDPLAPIKDAVTADGDIVVPIDAEAWGFWLKGAFGEPVTTEDDGIFTHIFESGAWVLPSLSIEKGLPDVPRFEMFAGCMINSLSWQMQRSGLLTSTVNIIAQGEDAAMTSQAGTPANIALSRFGHFNGSISREGISLGNVVSTNITYSNNLDRIETIRADGKIDGADPSLAALTGSTIMRFADTTLLEQALNGQPCELKFAYAFGEIAFELVTHAIYLPRPRVEIPGPQGVQVTFEWQAAQDPASGIMCTARLVNKVEEY